MMKVVWIIGLLVAGFAFAEKPNVIFILADDMGYGDVSHAGGKVPTPHCDRLAKEGMRFTDAHTTSSVCTPTRYGVLTGRYNWRSRLKKHVLFPPAPALIDLDRQTVAGFLGEQGYHSACIGKWHLGLSWTMLPNGQKGKDDKGKSAGKGWTIDYTKPLNQGPTHIGFDYFWGIAASLDMPPYVYIENDRVTDLPTKTKAFNRKGPGGVDFEAVNCLADFARESRKYIKKQAADTTKPFFLYLPLTSPHTPIVPSAKFKGKSGLTKYLDFVLETDWVVGEVLAELDAQGISDNTLVIFTTDNGCSPAAKIPEQIKKGHKPNADWRGHKADIYEGGHRVPFLVRWPAKIKAGSSCDSTITTADFFRTAAAAAGAESAVSAKMAEDSYSFLPDLLQTGTTARKTSIHHSINGSFAIRQGKWKLCLCPASGGWSAPRPSPKLWNGDAIVQLFDLEADPAESNNLQAKHPEVVDAMVKQLHKEIVNGRCTTGPVVTNDGAIPFHEKLLERFPILGKQ